MPQVIAYAVAYVWSATAATAFTVGATAVSYATIIGYAVTIGASIAYSSAQNAKMRNAMKGLGDQGRNAMVRDPAAFQRRVYGEVPLTGPITFMHTTGTKNEILHLIVEIAGHEVQELGTVYFDGSDGWEEVTLDGGGYATGKYAGHFACGKHLGTPDQAADGALMGAAPSKWTANHRLRGNAYMYCQFKFNTDLFPNGVPTTRVMTKGAKVLDPRVGIYIRTCDMVAGNTHVGVDDDTDLAVGMRVIGAGFLEGTRIVSIDGSGTFFTVNVAPQLTNATAFVGIGADAWSANGALCCADYMTNFKFGRRINWSRFNRTGLSAEANICDENIVLEDASTEKRYECHGVVSSDQDALDEMLTCMAGRRTDTGGTWSIFAGAYRTPELAAFTDDDIIGNFQLTPRASMRETFSGVRGTYLSPQNNWQPADFPAIKNALYAADDGNIRRWKDVSYAFTISPAAAQRLAKIELERGRQQQVFQAVFKLKHFAIQCMDTIRLTRSVLGWTNKEFEVLDWELRTMKDAQGGPYLALAIAAQETAAGIFDWNDGEETTVDLAPNTDLPDPFDVPAPSGLTLLTDTTTVILQPDGTVVPRIKVTWSLPNNIYIESGGHAELEFKLSSTGVWIPWNGAIDGSKTEEWITDVKVGLQYNVRLRFRNQIGVRGSYSSATSATVVGDTTSPNVPSNLSVTANPGFILVDWDPSTSVTVNEYEVERATAGSGGPYTSIGQTAGSQFSDPNVVAGSTYWYRVRAESISGFVSSYLGPASATAVAPSGSIPLPGTPTAPVDQAISGVYGAGDGTQFAFRTIRVWPLPTDAEWQNLLYRRNGASEWLVAGQYSNAGIVDVRLDDLTPGVTYDIAVQAWSASGSSSVVAGTSVTAPNKVAAPTNIAGFVVYAGNSSSYSPKPAVFISGQRWFTCRIIWTKCPDADFLRYEYCTANIGASQGDIETSWNGQGAPVCYEPDTHVAAGTPLVTGFYARTVNRSGIKTLWIYFTNLNGYWGYPINDLANQSSNDVQSTGLRIGNFSVSKFLTRHALRGTYSIAGGGLTDTVNIGISGLGFTVAPDVGNFQTDNVTAIVRYDWDDSNSSTIVLRIRSVDGSNLPSSININGEILDYS
jgi:hypothetical protein